MTDYLIDHRHQISWQPPVLDKDLETAPSPSGYSLVTPEMTANDAPSPYVASASTEYSGDYQAWEAFDHVSDSSSDSWITTSGTTTGWVKLDFGNGNGKTITKYTLTSRLDETTSAPKSWVFEGSNNDSDWTELDSQSNITDWSNNETKSFEIDNETSYRYVRLSISENCGDNQTAVAEIGLYTGSSAPVKGDRHIIAGTGGDWSESSVNDITYYTGAGWVFVTPAEGWICWVEDENLYYCFDGSSWSIKFNWTGTVEDNDYSKFTSAGLVGRSYSEVKTDLSLNNVENTAISTWIGSENITVLGTIGTGVWNATALGADKVPNHDNLNGYVADEHIDWTDATDTLLITKDNLDTTTLEAIILQNTDTGDVQVSPALVFKGNGYSGGNYPIQWWMNTADICGSGTDFEFRCKIPSIAYDALVAVMTYDCTFASLGNLQSGGDIISEGNIGVGTETFGTSADKVLCIANGTVPTSSPVDSVQLYAEDQDPEISLLLHCDGDDASVDFPDASVWGQTVTAVGSAQVDTDYKEFGTGSALFDGAGDRLTVTNDTSLVFGTGDFTIDFWARLTSIQQSGSSVIERNTFIAKNGYGASNGWCLAYGSDGTGGHDKLVWWAQSTKKCVSSASALSIETWYHIAITRESGTLRMFIGGTKVSEVADTTNYSATLDIFVGQDSGYIDSNRDLNGRIDELRIVKGSAKWTSDFTPPTSPYALSDSGYSELVVRDELGNTTTLSPHNFSLFTPDSSYEFPWSYYSKNEYIGKEINVDMYGAIQALEELTGKQFIYIRNIEKRDWNKDQSNNIQTLKDSKDVLINKKMNEMIEISALDALDYDGKLKSGCYRNIEGYYRKYTKEEASIIIENKLNKLRIKEIPKWIKDRKAINRIDELADV